MPGGVWRALYPDGSSRPFRQVLDTIYVSRIARELPRRVRRRMAAFAKAELVVRSPQGANATAGVAWQWVRALSLQDSLATHKLALRPDHGITGAYAAWPAVRLLPGA